MGRASKKEKAKRRMMGRAEKEMTNCSLIPIFRLPKTPYNARLSRVSSNGKTLASQATDVGSIPITRFVDIDKIRQPENDVSLVFRLLLFGVVLFGLMGWDGCKQSEAA